VGREIVGCIAMSGRYPRDDGGILAREFGRELSTSDEVTIKLVRACVCLRYASPIRGWRRCPRAGTIAQKQ